ncbi:MAG TPA: coenzyme F420-0:L-glutamate ligase [Nitrososphaeraceae archaeon]|nr:coenzyme F420-0:L-glutamate ligase [Nitrososphaeraceae archaeon]
MGSNTIEIIPLPITKDIEPNDNLDSLILRSLKNSDRSLFDRDIIIIAQKIISKAEDRVIKLGSVTPSKQSLEIAGRQGKDARIIELIIRESTSIVKMSRGIIITETKHGFICANSGIDQSNIRAGHETALLLPEAPDRSAQRIRNSIMRKTKKQIAVIITDTFGRPFREGQTNVAIGIAGIRPIKSYIGKKDIFGKELRATEIAIADEIASAAELVMGKLERVPVVIMRGYKYRKSKRCSAYELIRSRKKDLFR